MVRHTVRRAGAALGAAVFAAAAGMSLAQGGPVAAMFRDDLKRLPNFAPSFLPMDLPPATAGAAGLQLYLSAGDLERAFDTPAFRPDAAVIPTNTNLDLKAPSPATQRVLVDRVARHADLMRDLQAQIEARRKSSPTSGAGVLQIGVDTFVAELGRGAAATGGAALPRRVCLIATNFATGVAIDRRELFTQDRVRKGIAACLAALDAAGARSVIMPLLGASSSGTQTNDPVYEGQRLLKECRLVNAVAGIALGIHDFLPGRRAVQELGILQWDQEISGMFEGAQGSRFAGAAYRMYAEQVTLALRKGLAGDRTTPADLNGNCASTLNVQ